MGKAGRIACIFTPYVVSVAALVAIIFVGLGSTKSGSGTLDNLYFFRADLSNLTSSGGSSLADALASDLGDLANLGSDSFEVALAKSKAEGNIRDFYDIGLLGYCSGNKTSSGSFEVDYCSEPKAEFAFDPVTVWKLNTSSSDSDSILPSNLKKAIDTYKTVSKWMFIAYAIAFGATIVELLVGLFAICSRLGSLFTSIFAGIAFFFTIASSITATALFAALTGTFNSALKQYGMHGSMGKNIYVATWIATAFAFGGSLFWLLSSCCCSGRSPYHGDRRRGRGISAEKAPYTYERVGSPYGGVQPTTPYMHQQAPHDVPMDTFHQSNNYQQRQNAYEPFRHV
ncbi:integral membrane protein [Talaromyces proteolyticus]|uniref:Integral membrane protein n=1 Tax=Talaromyces proteolyticus TaxID=1131652 RepID=A0AAD4Q0K4_9EURO|nr:uncharacterized protein BGW36DRAFT_291623 [Talaromyces proteolyticus]KAH8700924.1 integral membrane protein [Talaromyces proteolyticus]